MDEQLEFVKQIASRLDSVGIPYMMTGSMALAVYSMPRMTRDIDLVVEVTLDDVDKLVGLFINDCYIDRERVEQAVRERGIFNIIHNHWVVKADFIIRKDEDYRKEEFARRKTVDVEDVSVSVVAPEDLILSKLVWANRSQSDLQLHDVCRMISSVTELDWSYLDKWANILGIADFLRKAKKDE